MLLWVSVSKREYRTDTLYAALSVIESIKWKCGVMEQALANPGRDIHMALHSFSFPQPGRQDAVPEHAYKAYSFSGVCM